MKMFTEEEVQARIDAAVAETVEWCAKVLHGMGDTAYCTAIDMSKSELCLGEEYKISGGTFTLANLRALEAVRGKFGEAAGLWNGEQAIRALAPSGKPSDEEIFKRVLNGPQPSGSVEGADVVVPRIRVTWVVETEFGYAKAMRVTESNHPRFIVGSRFDFGFLNIAAEEGYEIHIDKVPEDVLAAQKKE